MAATPQDVIGFWRSAGPEKWFAKSDRFDQAIALKFEPVHHAAARGEYDGWAATAEGALALLILLDQFPRNLHRGSAEAFASDAHARDIARDVVLAHRFDLALTPTERVFLYLPFEHSEDPADQELAVKLLTERLSSDPEMALHALAHQEVIARYGRFPTRNAALGRESSPEEQDYLDQGGYMAVVNRLKSHAPDA